VDTKIVVEDPAEVPLCAPIGRSVVIGQVEVGDAQVEGAMHDGTLGVEGSVVTEVLPQTQ